jgi:hypothetical protein
MKSDATILSFLTLSEDYEKIVFALCREVEDEAPSKIYWYPQKGEHGIAEYIWEEKSLKQWLLIGQDSEILKIWDSLVFQHEFHYEWGNQKVIFKMPEVNKKEELENFVKIRDIEVCGRNEYSVEYVCVSIPYDNSFLIGEESNCAFIEGYKLHDRIKSVVPPGLFSEKSLTKYLEKNICAVFEKRGIYWQLRGDRTSLKDGEPSKFIGFIQASEEIKRSHNICIRNLEGTTILGEGSIDVHSGKWLIELSEPAGKGQFLIQKKQTGNILCGEKFYLIKDIKINTEIVHSVLTDLYGRKINVSKKEELEPFDNPIIWDSNSAPDQIQGEIELSDKLTSILLTFGKRLVFNDPYFWGDFKEDNINIVTSVSQKIFLNALITAIARGKIEELIIIGYWQRAKNFIQGDKNSLINKYKKIYELIKLNFKNSQLLNLKAFEIVFSKEPFHDRYWMGGDIIYHVSNSVNGAFESGELQISKLDHLGKMKHLIRLNKRYSVGEKIKLL